MTIIRKCYWWNRWYHERLRNIDIITLLPIFQKQAELRLLKEGKYTEYDSWTSSDFQLERDQLVDRLFELHKHMPGQEHWHCECASFQPPFKTDE